MSRYLITVRGPSDREQAARWAMHAKEGMRIEFKQAKRSGEQNDKLWAMLTEVAAQVPWHGIKLAPDDWKFIFLDALKRELRVVPNIDGTGFVNLGRSSSDLSKSEMSDLIEIIHAFGAGHGVVFKDSNSVEPGAPQAQAQPSKPAAVEESPLPDTAAGNPSQSSAPPVDEEAQASDASPAGLPSGWEITYSAALRRAQKKESLSKYASEYWKQYGGWAQHKDGPNGATAAAIYDAFNQNFGNKEQIEMLLREII